MIGCELIAKEAKMSSKLREWMQRNNKDNREKLAKHCNTSVEYLWHIARGYRYASPQLAVWIEEGTNKEVTRYDKLIKGDPVFLWGKKSK